MSLSLKIFGQGKLKCFDVIIIPWLGVDVKVVPGTVDAGVGTAVEKTHLGGQKHISIFDWAIFVTIWYEFYVKKTP